jgi:hypothetical protein
MYPHRYSSQNSRRAWQTDFLQANRLILGHCAWQGFLDQGRGAVVCHVDPAVGQGHDFQAPQLVRFNLQFVPSSLFAIRIQDYDFAPAVVAELLGDLATYAPDQSLILLLVAADQVAAALIQGSLAPPDCDQQVCQNWSEFQLDCL